MQSWRALLQGDLTVATTVPGDWNPDPTVAVLGDPLTEEQSDLGHSVNFNSPIYDTFMFNFFHGHYTDSIPGSPEIPKAFSSLYFMFLDHLI